MKIYGRDLQERALIAIQFLNINILGSTCTENANAGVCNAGIEAEDCLRRDIKIGGSRSGHTGVSKLDKHVVIRRKEE
jgi:hypothetical protein